MFVKDDYKIKVFQNDGIELKGYYCEKDKERCVIGFAGLGGTCDKMFCAIADRLITSGLSFLFANTQASYIIKELKEKLNDGSCRYVLRGGAYENYDNTIKDMIFWVNYIREKGFKEIYLVGASLACNRIITLLNTKQFLEIKRVVLICPQDMAAQTNQEMMLEAMANIEAGEGENILTQKIFGYCEVCGRTYRDLFSRKDINNLPYLTENADFGMLERVSLPIFAIIGECDQGLSYSTLSAEEAMQCLQLHNSNLIYKVIPNASHSFKNYETELAKLVCDYINDAD